MKKIFALLLAVMMIFALVSCGSEKLTGGKWVFGPNSYEFTDDGKVTAICNGMTTSGTYTKEDGKLILTVNGLLGETTKELTYKIDGNELTLEGDVTLLGAGDLTMTFTKEK